MDIPHVAPLRQTAPQPTITDVAAETRRHWRDSRVAGRIRRGARVAVGVGSRGIANVSVIVRATLDSLRDLGAQPFVVAAMGSHGGATAAGQRQLLAEYGISEQALGVPVKTDMTAVRIGTNSWGEPVWWDKNALEADAVVTVSRVKPHTDFRGRYESGIVKMLVIGLGKRDGASQHHRWGFRGLRDMLPETARVIVEKTPFIGGLAVLENAREQTARLQVVDRDELFDVEPSLLEEARGLMGRLPFEQLDLLVLGEIGKNYSGAGIDPNVVGRLLIETQPEFESPKITRICALDLSPESHGNGTGCGIADLTTERLLAAIDPAPFRMNNLTRLLTFLRGGKPQPRYDGPTRVNNLTACFLRRSQLPFAFPTDRTCIEAGLETCWQPRPEAVRLAFVPNTLEVEHLWASAPLVEEARKNPHLEVTGDLRPLPFDAAGNLVQEKLFPHSTRGRRKQVDLRLDR
ncbi:MAG TPA: lactate racemase domain-containing protein [Gemmataceae bacterium]